MNANIQTSTESIATVENLNSIASTAATTIKNVFETASAEQIIETVDTVYHFGWLDYSFFIILLSLSALIGAYYGFFSKHKQNNTEEYILGGRTMKIIPVATSMIATFVF